MTVSFAIMDEGTIDQTIAELRAAERAMVRAFKGGLKAGGAFMAERIADGIPYDTGAMEDSIYVQEGIVGIAAPYAGIVEERHPSNPHHVKRRVVENQDRMTDVIARTTEDLMSRGAGPESVRHRFRESPGYIPRETFHGRVKAKRAAQRRAKAGR